MKRIPLLIAFLIVIFYKPGSGATALLLKKTSSAINIILSSEIFPGRILHMLPLI
jgi:hypothetical protein